MDSQRLLVLKNNKLLKNININQLSDRQILGQLLAVNEGEFIYKNNESARSVYFVISGRVKCISPEENEWFIDREVSGDEYFGYDDNNNGVRSHSAIALSDSYLIELSFNEIEFLMGLPKVSQEDVKAEEVSEGEEDYSFPDDHNGVNDFSHESTANNIKTDEDFAFDESLPYDFDELRKTDKPKDEITAPDAEEVTTEEVTFSDDSVTVVGTYDAGTSESFEYPEKNAEIVTVNDDYIKEIDEHQVKPDISHMEKFAEAVNILNTGYLLSETYDAFLKAACYLTESDQGILFLPHEKESFRSVTGEQKTFIQSGMGISGWAIQKNEPVVVNDVKTSGKFNAEFDEPPEYQTKSMLVLPVENEQGKIELVYQLFNNEQGNYTQEHISLLKILYKVALEFINKAKLYEADIKKQRLSALKKISGFLDNDIKKPILVSKGSAEYLRKSYLPDNVDKVLNMITGQLDSVVDLLRTISDYSSGNLKLRLNPQYLNRLLKEFIKNYEPLFNEKNIDLRFDLDDECKIKIDNSRFEIVIDNLINNAVNALPEGGTITLSSYVESDFVKISIRDNGCGIEPKMLDYIFEPFVSSEVENSGLGLFISKIIVEKHRGEIKINSTGKKGTDILIKLPLDKNF